MVLVRARVQRVKSLFDKECRKVVYAFTGNIFAHTKKKHIFCISMFGEGQDRISQNHEKRSS